MIDLEKYLYRCVRAVCEDGTKHYGRFLCSEAYDCYFVHTWRGGIFYFDKSKIVDICVFEEADVEALIEFADSKGYVRNGDVG